MQAAVDAVRTLMITSTQLSRCCWVRKTNLRFRATEQSGGGCIDVSFTDYSQRSAPQVLQEKCAQQLTEAHSIHALFSVCSSRDDNVITSKPTWKLKHTNSILEYFEYFCQISSKSIHIISSYIHRFNVGSFLPARHYASAGNRHCNVSVRPSVCHAPVLCQNEES